MKDKDEADGQRFGWRFVGSARPSFAIEPAAGQESVWDYPRPPVCVPDTRLVEVRLGDLTLARTQRAIRVLETASPPTFYLPPDDIRTELLRAAPGHSFCEWKGQASYFDIVTTAGVIAQAAWTYPHPLPAFSAIEDYLAFYPARVSCRVAGEKVRAQQGDFYGGWITDDIVGPFKGEPGTGGW